MPYSETKKAYNADYIKQNIKRVPLDVQKDQYEIIKAAAEASGESVNGYIKKAIEMRLSGSDAEPAVKCAAISPERRDRFTAQEDDFEIVVPAPKQGEAK